MFSHLGTPTLLDIFLMVVAGLLLITFAVLVIYSSVNPEEIDFDEED